MIIYIYIALRRKAVEDGFLPAPNSIPGSAVLSSGKWNDILSHMMLLGRAEIYDDLHIIKSKKVVSKKH